MTSPYQPKQFEKQIQEFWEKNRVYKTGIDLSKKKYILVEFPYPSGAGLHAGHARIFTGTDVLARFYRMNGQAVLHPMGWDAFGLPAENAAIKTGENPSDLTKKYIQTFKSQMMSLGFSYDWSKEINTTESNYYAVTQWLFIQFYTAGLLYKKNTTVQFCEFCKTGLAQEEVLSDGTHERCGKLVVVRNLPQWIFRITKYADRLTKDLEGLDWPRGILEMQKNWIGKKEGIEITYKVDNTNENITCFTTRPDTNFGATFIVVAPEHEFVSKILDKKITSSESNVDTISKYVEKSLSKNEVDRMKEEKVKTGVFTGFYVTNELNNKKLPVWISDFVLKDFGTGAVVGVPGHDRRDYDFATTFGIEVIRVVKIDSQAGPITSRDQVQEDEGVMINSEFLDGLDIHQATEKIIDYMVKHNMGKRVSTYHLRDWIFSRQRYWGEPIPMIFCQSCAEKKISYWSSGTNQDNISKYKLKTSEWINEIEDSMYGWFPISEQDLPLKLPHLDKYEPTGTGESPLSRAEKWVVSICPNCGGKARRETDTMPNWAGSCWYFLAYVMDPVPSDRFNKSGREFISNFKKQIAKTDWLPVDIYIGGAEHTVLHLLYSRFWTKALYDLGLVNFKEPFLTRKKIGIVIAEDGRKMSKSYGNVINPDSVIDEYGADTLRVYEMFMAPFDQEVAWSTNALQGSYRFMKRIWQMYHNSDKIEKNSQNIDRRVVAELQNTIAKITSDITNVKFNTCVSSMMQFLNSWEAGGAIGVSDAKKFLQVLAPFAPFMSDYLWKNILKESMSIHVSKWPQVSKDNHKQTQIKLPVQVDGKLRAVIDINPELTQDEVVDIAKNLNGVSRWLEEKYNINYVSGRVLNFANSK